MAYLQTLPAEILLHTLSSVDHDWQNNHNLLRRLLLVNRHFRDFFLPYQFSSLSLSIPRRGIPMEKQDKSLLCVLLDQPALCNLIQTISATTDLATATLDWCTSGPTKRPTAFISHAPNLRMLELTADEPRLLATMDLVTTSKALEIFKYRTTDRTWNASLPLATISMIFRQLGPTAHSLRHLELIASMEDRAQRSQWTKPRPGIGSLRGFVALQTLSIDLSSLVGRYCEHDNGALEVSPRRVANLLPDSLVNLVLRMRGSEYGRADKSRYLYRIVDGVRNQLPRLTGLRRIGYTADWDKQCKMCVQLDGGDYDQKLGRAKRSGNGQLRELLKTTDVTFLGLVGMKDGWLKDLSGRKV